MCPVTSQPDLSTVAITYVPDEWCVETKSLKLYLWGFRQRPVFAEALAAEIAGEVMATARPHRVPCRPDAAARAAASSSAPRAELPAELIDAATFCPRVPASVRRPG